MPLASWVQRHDSELTALLSVAIALVLATLVDRAFARRGRVLAQAVSRGELTAVADTRLRFLRRLVSAVILLAGVLIALSQFSALDRLATSVLASGALLAAVVGFAARQTLANAVAGVMLAITQPLRIGDAVSFEGQGGTVEDVRLTYTYLRTGEGARLIIPNERLAGGILRNDTIVDPLLSVEVSVWIAPDADSDRALTVLGELHPDAPVRIAEATPDGVRLTVAGDPAHAAERAAAEAQLRTEALRVLRAEGLAPGGTG